MSTKARKIQLSLRAMLLVVTLAIIALAVFLAQGEMDRHQT